MLQNLWIQSYGIICTVGCLMVAWVFLCNIAASMNTGRGGGFTLGGLDRLFAFIAVRIAWPAVRGIFRGIGQLLVSLGRFIRSLF